MINVISYVIIGIGISFMLIGILGIYRFKNFYPRMLAASKVDTVGLLTLIIGVVLQNGVSFFSAKVLLIAAVLLIMSPLVSHIVTRSAYVSGHGMEDDA